MTAAEHIRALAVLGHKVTVDDALGKLCVEYDCAIGWEDLQKIKDAVWGQDARAIEVYPRAVDVVNNGNYRHLWRLGEGDFCPDLLGCTVPDFRASVNDRLLSRCHAAWSEAEKTLPEPLKLTKRSQRATRLNRPPATEGTKNARNE